MSEKIYDVIVAGAGPAGLGATLYARRAMLDTLLIEKEFDGGQILSTDSVDNYLGLPGINGYEMGMKFSEHVASFEPDKVTGTIEDIKKEGDLFKVSTSQGEYQSKTLVYAMGAKHRLLGIPGEQEYGGRGVSYCATCDGAFYRGKDTIVVGGGDVALEDALYLSKLCNKVYLMHRRDQFRAAKVIQDKVLANDKITVIWNARPEEILGNEDRKVKGLSYVDTVSGEKGEVTVDGVFIAVGMLPQSELVTNLVDCDHGYICGDETCKTSLPGFYAVGDVRTKQLRQVITAVADGANAITSIEEYLH